MGEIKFSEAYQQNRICLKDALPLERPLCISFEPTNICNFKCLMCCQSTEEFKKEGGPFINMSYELFSKGLEDVKKFCTNGNKIKLVKLYSLGEPLLNPLIEQMLIDVKKADVAEKVEITTNASLLTESMAKTFVDYELDYLRCSIYAIDDEQQKSVTGANIKARDILAKVAKLKKYRDSCGKTKPFICAKMFEDNRSDVNEQFKKMWEDASDEQYIDVAFEVPKLEKSALDKLFGSEENGKVAQKTYMERALYKERKACRYPFTHLTIRSNGDVSICCTDWSRSTVVGNINEQSLLEIWESKRLYDFRKMMLLTKGANHPLCSSCEIPLKDCPEDNIDDVEIGRFGYK